MYGVQIFALRREQGRLQEMEAGIKGFVQMYPAIPAWRTALALVHAEMGREKEAREEFEVLAADDFAVLPRDGNWPIAMALLSEVCAFLGDADRAAFVYEELRPWEDLCIMAGPALDSYGATSRLMGRLAVTLGHWDDAERHFEHALKRNTEMGSGRWATRTRLQYAMMLVERDAPGDQQKALALLADALDTAQRLGLKRDLEDCLALKLKIQGVDLSGIGSSIDTVAREALAEQPDLKPHAAPDGTVTIMFSDIEGSTALADRLGDKRFMEVLREHNTIVRELIKANGGFEVKSEGDGFMIAFQSARKALECSIAIQKALDTRNTSVGAPLGKGGGAGGAAPGGRSGAEPVHVRIGLHAGEVIKEGEDFFGRNVIMAARVASQAHGGEILASAVLKALVEGSDVSWGEKRTVPLKGLSGEHEIWPVKWS
jgi:class 3 adenylate cyclase